MRPTTNEIRQRYARLLEKHAGYDWKNDVWACIARLCNRVDELEAIIAKHDLCHDLHGKVGRDEFEEGCRRESIKEFGSCGWAEKIAELEAKVDRLEILIALTSSGL